MEHAMRLVPFLKRAARSMGRHDRSSRQVPEASSHPYRLTPFDKISAAFAAARGAGSR